MDGCNHTCEDECTVCKKLVSYDGKENLIKGNINIKSIKMSQLSRIICK